MKLRERYYMPRVRRKSRHCRFHILSATARALLAASVLSATQFSGVSGRYCVAEQLRLGNDQADASGAKVTGTVQETPQTTRVSAIVDASDR
jgi:hypothetical protein